MNVCIVGHGPSTKGRKLGELIDSHDVVVRHVECDWQDQEDYGVKYDYGIFCPAPIWQAEDAVKRPDRYWKYDPLFECPTDEPVTTIFRDKVCDNINEFVTPLIIGRHFSRGTAAVIAAIYILRPAEINLVGFDAVLQGFFEQRHHPSELKELLIKKGKELNFRKKLLFDTHEWHKEMCLIKTIKKQFCISIGAL